METEWSFSQLAYNLVYSRGKKKRFSLFVFFVSVWMETFKHHLNTRLQVDFRKQKVND